MVGDMNLLENKSLLRNLLFQGDQLHTLGGGIAQITMEMERQEDGFLISVFAPSVSPENFKILTEGKYMQLFAAHLNQEGSGVRIPIFYRKIDLPDYADAEGIIAEHKGNELKVFVPIGLNTSSGKHEIQIKQL
jgi:HSP20 family protein